MGLRVSESSNLRDFLDASDALDGVDVATGVATPCGRIAAPTRRLLKFFERLVRSTLDLGADTPALKPRREQLVDSA
jgi:hypothetical protein